MTSSIKYHPVNQGTHPLLDEISSDESDAQELQLFSLEEMRSDIGGVRRSSCICVLWKKFWWAILVALLLITVVILLTVVRTHGSDHIWWKETAIYQIYPRSFQDSDGDGLGDINGIISRLDYLTDLGIRAVWLSPMYTSPMRDFGYDVADHTEIDPRFGTMQDFKHLVTQLHDRDIKLIMDFVPNHTSNEHIWFQKSEAGVAPYDDYYVWVAPRKNEPQRPPNNWISRFGNSTWQWSSKRQMWYLHKFLIEQPDLNFWNRNVQEEMKNILQFWLDLGVDGFRIDAITHLIETEHEDYLDKDEPLDKQYIHMPNNSYQHLKHIYTVNQPGSLHVAADWAKLFEAHGFAHDKIIFSVAEMTDLATPAENMRWYSTGLSLPFNFALSKWTSTTSSAQLAGYIQGVMHVLPEGTWPNWVLGNHDQHRVASRLGGSLYTDMANMLLLLLPGTPQCYYGDELGMTDVFVSWNQTKDPSGIKWGPNGYLAQTRDPERTPMQWDNTANAGFSTCQQGHTWLPLAKNYSKVNAAQQMADEHSDWTLFKELLHLKHSQPALRDHNANLVLYNTSTVPEPLLVFARNSTVAGTTSRTDDQVLCVLHIGAQQEQVVYNLKYDARVLAVSTHRNDYQPKEQLSAPSSITLHGGDALVLAMRRLPDY